MFKPFLFFSINFSAEQIYAAVILQQLKTLENLLFSFTDFNASIQRNLSELESIISLQAPFLVKLKFLELVGSETL
jgi:hypothetical protein